jgi:hypothetical protein
MRDKDGQWLMIQTSANHDVSLIPHPSSFHLTLLSFDLLS